MKTNEMILMVALVWSSRETRLREKTEASFRCFLSVIALFLSNLNLIDSHCKEEVCT
jgi:uncharacterized membrane protein YhhN